MAGIALRHRRAVLSGPTNIIQFCFLVMSILSKHFGLAHHTPQAVGTTPQAAGYSF